MSPLISGTIHARGTHGHKLKLPIRNLELEEALRIEHVVIGEGSEEIEWNFFSDEMEHTQKKIMTRNFHELELHPTLAES